MEIEMKARCSLYMGRIIRGCLRRGVRGRRWIGYLGLIRVILGRGVGVGRGVRRGCLLDHQLPNRKKVSTLIIMGEKGEEVYGGVCVDMYEMMSCMIPMFLYLPTYTIVFPLSFVWIEGYLEVRDRGLGISVYKFLKWKHSREMYN